jgi:hypothetical protein
MRTYAVVPIAELDNINFSEVLQTSKDTVVKNRADTDFIVKWEGGETPASVSGITPAVTTYDHAGILTLLGTVEWTPEDTD